MKDVLNEVPSYIDISKIKQDDKANQHVKTFSDVLSKQAPDLIHQAITKVEIGMFKIIMFIHLILPVNIFSCPVYELISEFIEDENSELFIQNIDLFFFKSSYDDAKRFFEKCQSSIISLEIDPDPIIRFETGEFIFPQCDSQDAILIRSNEKF
jgi:hypothetical protein